MEGTRVQVVVLCGGLATRMRPLSERLPISLFPVAGRRFLDWQLESLVRGGATEVLLCTGHLGNAIAAQVAGAAPAGLRTAISDEGDQKLGTGGALALAAARGLLAPRFIVQYGDSYLRLDYRALLSTPGDAVMSVSRSQNRRAQSHCVVADGLVVQCETAAPPATDGWMEYGASAIDRAPTENAPRDLAQLFALLACERRLRAFAVEEPGYEIGSSEGLARLEALLSGGVA